MKLPALPALPAAPLDPALAAVLGQMAAAGAPPLETLPPAVARQVAFEGMASLELLPPPVGAVQARTIDGPGGALPLRLYTPAGGAAPRALLVYAHGGGFVIGSLDSHDTVCRRLCHDTGRVVVAVDYRLAPEHPFPAAVDDVEAALRWAFAHAGELGVDAQRIALAGDSAGANLAVAVAQRAAGIVGAVAAIYPVVQHYSEPSASLRELAGVFLTDSAMRWFADCYLGAGSAQARHPEFAALQSDRLHHLPPTWVATMGHDPLRDEGHALALALAERGVAVEHRHYPQGMHACIHFTAVAPVGGRVLDELAEWLRAS